jgi:hypothetical protein
MEDDAFDYVLEAELLGLYEEKRPLPAPTAPAIKGTCRHCGKVVGRGVWAHEKHCKAKP